MRRLFAVLLTLLICLTVASAAEMSLREIKPVRPLDPPPSVIVPTPFCGNGVAEDGEECDPGQPDYGLDPDLGGATCEGQGFNGGGEVSCTSTCTLDISACYCDVGTTFPATGQTQCWNAFGEEIDCAGTGHDGDTRTGGALTYTDNGDGTITDENTGLMWERKNDAGGIHDKDNRYAWEATFTDFIDKLNHTCEGDGLVVCDSDDICGAGGQCGFAGYRDWRMPNIKELQSIVDYNVPDPGPTVAPAFNTGCVSGCTECSCTVSSPYWSSSSIAGYPLFARYVYFYHGSVGGYYKFTDGYVRGVRGGS